MLPFDRSTLTRPKFAKGDTGWKAITCTFLPEDFTYMEGE
jgi:hypothetical protein